MRGVDIHQLLQNIAGEILVGLGWKRPRCGGPRGGSGSEYQQDGDFFHAVIISYSTGGSGILAGRCASSDTTLRLCRIPVLSITSRTTIPRSAGSSSATGTC